MALYLIGIGLGDEKDITLRGLEAIKRCELVYLENYTSKLTDAGVEDLEILYGKKVIPADRDLVENKLSKIISEAKEKDVALLIIGDPLGATTHINIKLEAEKQDVKVKIIHNTSILNVVGEVGLELYKFGHVTSIPFDNSKVKAPIEVFKKNYEDDLHTLFLLDLDPKNNKFMTISEAAEYLLNKKVDENLLSIACAGIGSEKKEIKTAALKELKDIKLSRFPQCLIIPAKKLHFVEEESIRCFE